MTHTFLFYDLETSGTSPGLAQIIEFGAIICDENLVVEEKINNICKLSPDTIPEPGAFLTHKISFEEIANGVSEKQLIEQIFNLVNTPNTINNGYNSLKFDNEFLRYGFSGITTTLSTSICKQL